MDDGKKEKESPPPSRVHRQPPPRPPPLHSSPLGRQNANSSACDGAADPFTQAKKGRAKSATGKAGRFFGRNAEKAATTFVNEMSVSLHISRQQPPPPPPYLPPLLLLPRTRLPYLSCTRPHSHYFLLHLFLLLLPPSLSPSLSPPSSRLPPLLIFYPLCLIITAIDPYQRKPLRLNGGRVTLSVFCRTSQGPAGVPSRA